jgi:hypothetical protein
MVKLTRKSRSKARISVEVLDGLDKTTRKRIMRRRRKVNSAMTATIIGRLLRNSR